MDLSEKSPSFSSSLLLANELLASQSFGEILPYRCFNPDTLLFHNAQGVGFVLETLPLVGCGAEIPRQLTGFFQHTLPLGSNLQCLLIASSRINPWLTTWCTPRKQAFRELGEERCAYLKKKSQDFGIRTFRVFFSYSDSSCNVEKALGIREKLSTTLKGWGLPVKTWKASDLLETIDEFLNPLSSEKLSLTWNPHDFLHTQVRGDRMQITPTQIIFGEDEFILRLYTPRVFPNFWHLSAMNFLIGDPYDEFLRFQGGFFISYSVHICDEKTLKTRMLAKCGNVEKQAASPIAKYVPSLRKEEQEWRYVREKFEEGQRLVRTRYQVGLLCRPELLAREEQTLFNLYRSQRWELVLDKYLQLPSLLSCLPMTWGEGGKHDSQKFQKTKTTLSHEPANLIPLQGEWQGTKSPGLLLVGRRGQLFYWSPFDNNEGNYNVCVVGRSGSGKSVFMQEFMTSLLGLGGRVFVLDVGRSFEKTTKLLRGTYVEFSAQSQICINPFSSIPRKDPEASSDALAMLKPILSLMAAPKEGTRDIEDSYLEQALHTAWQEKKNAATITDVADCLLAHRDPVAISLGERLYPYTQKGGYGRFFNGPSTIDLSHPLVVIEMEELKERKDLQSVIIQMIILQITNSIYMGDRKTPSCLILDEAWDMLRGKQSGIFIETAARRLRKYFGGLVVGTQSINDFYATPGAQAAFDNADWMCLLSQKDESIALLKNSKRLSMDPSMERTLRSLHTEQGKYAEIMIKGPKGFAVGRLLLDPFSRLLYSTKANEFSSIQTLLSQGLSLREAIQSLLKERFVE